MTDIKLIPGKKYWVADREHDWIINTHLKFVITHNDVNYFETNGDLIYWKLVREIPSDHYTAETFPKGLVWMSNTSTPSNHELVTGVYPEHIQFSNGAYLNYSKFGDDQLISTDRINWRKAVPESEGYTPVLGGGGSSTGYESVARGSGGGSIHGRRHDR